MPGVDFRVIFEEGVQGSKPAAAPSSEVPTKSTGREAASKPGKGEQTVGEAIYGAGRYAAGEAGLGRMVGTLETIARHLGNILNAATKIPVSAGEAAGKAKVKLPEATGPAKTTVQVPEPSPSAANIPAEKTAEDVFREMYGNMPEPTKRGEILPPPKLTGVEPASEAASAVGTAGGSEAVAAAGEGVVNGLTTVSTSLLANPLGAALVAAAGAVVGFAAAVAAAVYVVTKSINILHTEGERIQAYSGDLARQYAQSDVRAMQADMRRAQRIGPDVAQVENMRSRILEKIADIGTEIYAILAKWIAAYGPQLEEVVAILQVVAESVPYLADQATAIIQLLSKDPREMLKAINIDAKEVANINRAARAINDYLEGKKAPIGGPMDPLLQAFLGMPAQPDLFNGRPAGWNLREGIGGGVPFGFGGP